MGVYQSAAEIAASVALNPLPLAPGAKAPAVRWRIWQERHLPPGLVARWRDDPRHAEANVCTTTGGVVGRIVVDVDSNNPADHAEAIARFGDSPVKVATPSGGLHLWFASPGGVANAQRVDGMPVDIRGDGGIAVLPPSVREGRGEYCFAEGDWAALQRLPLPRRGSLPSPSPKASKGGLGGFLAGSEAVLRGQRNEALFDHLRAFAASCDSEDQIAAEALRWNAELPEPLPVNEALKVAGSVSRYKATGSLIIPGGERMVALQASALKRLSPDAFYLLAQLRHEHAGLRQEFAISPPAMAAALGWRKPRFMAARDELVTAGYLARTHQGGAGKHDPARFRFAP